MASCAQVCVHSGRKAVTLLKNILKLILDLAMGIVFALLFNHKILGGMTFHEIAGLAIGGAVVAHILLNAKWVKAMVRKIFSCGTPAKSRLEAVLNTLLLVCLIVVLVSGVMKSKVLFPSIAEQFRDGNILGIHVGVSYVMLGIPRPKSRAKQTPAPTRTAVRRVSSPMREQPASNPFMTAPSHPRTAVSLTRQACLQTPLRWR